MSLCAAFSHTMTGNHFSVLANYIPITRKHQKELIQMEANTNIKNSERLVVINYK